MALFKPGSGVSALSGKNGGTIYSRNRGGAYSKAWAKPGGTSTPDQVDKEDIWIDMGAAWATQTLQQNDQWNTYARQLSATNRLGDPITLTAYQAFVECYTNARLTGLTPLDTPTEFSNRPAITNPGQLVVSTDGTNLTRMVISQVYAVVPSVSDAKLMVYAAPCARPTLRNVNTLYRYISLWNLSDASFDVYDDYNDKFGKAALEGWLAHVQLRIIDPVSMLGSTRVKIDEVINL